MNDENELYVTESALKSKCSGCEKLIEPGEKHLSGIQSCCGGCYRRLCKACIIQAAHLLNLEVREN